MNNLLFTLFFALLQNNTSAGNLICSDSITTIINKMVEDVKSKAYSTSVLNSGQLNWPHCDVIAKNRTNVNNNENVPATMYWIKMYIVRDDISNQDSLLFLLNMNNGDDWVINRYVDNGKYFQFIDGRSLTLLFEVNFDIIDTVRIFNNIQKNLENYIRYNFTGKDWKILNIDSTQIDVVLHVKGFDLPKEMDADLKIWTNGRILIADLPKIRKPYVDKFGLSVSKTLGGIPSNSQLPFKRFRNENNTNLKKECFKIFPWINDSLILWKKKFENGGAEVIIK